MEMKLSWGIGLLSLIIVFLVYPSCLHRYLAWEYGGEYLGSDGVRFQSRENNCGPASLAMVYDAFGIEAGQREIERSIEMTGNGTTMLELLHHAERNGLSAKGLKLTMEEFRRNQFPAILFVHNDHFAVADSVHEGEVYLRDPAIGRLKLSEKSLARIWHGEALVFCKK